MRSQAGDEMGGSLPGLPPGMPLVRVIAMPADANPHGDIFGGWLLSQMDLAGGSLAAQRDRKSTRLNSSHRSLSRMPSSA